MHIRVTEHETVIAATAIAELEGTEGLPSVTGEKLVVDSATISGLASFALKLDELAIYGGDFPTEQRNAAQCLVSKIRASLPGLIS